MNLNTVVRKTIRNNLFRSLAVTAAVMVSSAALFSLTMILTSAESGLRRSAARLGADIMVVPEGAEKTGELPLISGKAATLSFAGAVEQQVASVKGVGSTAPQVFIQSTTHPCCDRELLIIGFDPVSDFTVLPWLPEELRGPLGDDELIMGHGDGLYRKGDWLRLYGTVFTVAGTLEETGLNSLDDAVFLPLSKLRKIADQSGQDGIRKVMIPAGKISAVMVRVLPETDPARVAIAIEHEVQGVKAVLSDQILSSVRRQLTSLLRSSLFATLLLWLISVLLIALVFSMSVRERQREIGLLRSMGASKGHILRVILAEAVFLSAAGGLGGTALSAALLYGSKEFLRTSLKIPYFWPPLLTIAATACLSTAVAVAAGTAAALYPALRSVKMEPCEAIRTGE